jgi:RNA polymerase sigma factor (sigma-70 family)
VGSPFASIDQLAARLPFKVDDSAAVNTLFGRVVRARLPRDVELLDIWTYCFIWRYFTWKHIQREAGSPADFELVVTDAFERVRCGRQHLGNTSRYASWVSVVCKNTFLNFARKPNAMVFLDERAADLLESDAPVRVHDPAMLRSAIEAAVHRLPPHLVETARLYFIERFDYEEMSEITGHSAATLRAYVHKCMKRLRQDVWLKEFREYMNDDFFDD